EPRGCRTLRGVGEGCGGSNEKSTGTSLRPRAPALHHMQLLSSNAVFRDRAGAQRVSADFAGGAEPLRLRAAGLCRDAGAYSPADQRAEPGHSHDGDAGVETASRAGFAPAAQEENVCRTAAFVEGSAAEIQSSVLAAQILRFQCVEF